MKTRLFICIFCLSFLLFSTPSLAKGLPSYFTLQRNAGLPLLVFFEEAIIFDSGNVLDLPANPESEFFILRAYDIVDNQVIESQLSPMHYYPQADGTGIIYFVGAQNRGVYQEFDGNWYPAKTATNQLVNRYLAFGELVSLLGY